MIIDDEPDQVYAVEAPLQSNGYQTVSAFDGQEGLRLAKELQPALIILDLNLPKLPGLEVCRAIREDRDATFDRPPAEREAQSHPGFIFPRLKERPKKIFFFALGDSSTFVFHC